LCGNLNYNEVPRDHLHTEQTSLFCSLYLKLLKRLDVETNDHNAMARLLAVPKTVMRDVMLVPEMWNKCVCAEGTDSEHY
jgi:hypothetical protein